MPKCGGKLAPIQRLGELEEGSHPWEDHTYQCDVHVSPFERGGGPSGTRKEMWKIGGITVDGEPACPEILNLKFVPAGTCKVSCLGEGH